MVVITRTLLLDSSRCRCLQHKPEEEATARVVLPSSLSVRGGAGPVLLAGLGDAVVASQENRRA